MVLIRVYGPAFEGGRISSAKRSRLLSRGVTVVRDTEPYLLLVQKDQFTIGRDDPREKSDVDIPVDTKTVSRRHVRIKKSPREDVWFAEDMHSTYGTKIEGKKIPPGKNTFFGPGVVIVLGGITVQLARGEEFTGVPPITIKSWSAPINLADSSIGITKKHSNTITTQKPTMTFGRNAKNDIVLADKSVSKNHCEVSFVYEAWRIKDLHSRNGTYIISEKGVIQLEPGRNYELKEGNFFALGQKPDKDNPSQLYQEVSYQGPPLFKIERIEK